MERLGGRGTLTQDMQLCDLSGGRGKAQAENVRQSLGDKERLGFLRGSVARPRLGDKAGGPLKGLGRSQEPGVQGGG